MPWGGAADSCKACGKACYEYEKTTVDQVVFHKNCFKCAKCAKVMQMGDFTAIQGEIFCKPHFSQLFKLKGNYDEGFKAAVIDAQKAAEQQANKAERKATAPAPAAPAAAEPEPEEEPEAEQEEEEEEE